MWRDMQQMKPITRSHAQSLSVDTDHLNSRQTENRSFFFFFQNKKRLDLATPWRQSRVFRMTSFSMLFNAKLKYWIRDIKNFKI